MNGVTGMLHLLKSTSPNPDQARYVDLALCSSQNLLPILSDILDLSRIEAGAMELQNEPFAVEALGGPVIGSLEMEAANKKLALSVEIDPDLPGALRGDVGRLRQVLFNLLGNAIKYSEQGEVRLELCRLALVDILRQTGYEPVEAANGLEVLAFLAGEAFDAVLMDIQMPVMSGLEATRRIRSGEAGAVNPQAPIVALTAHAMTGARENVLNTGADDYVAKPIDFERLAVTLARVMQERRAGGPASQASGEASPALSTL